METAYYVAGSGWGCWSQHLRVALPGDLGFLTARQLGSKFESFETESQGPGAFHSVRESEVPGEACQRPQVSGLAICP